MALKLSFVTDIKAETLAAKVNSINKIKTAVKKEEKRFKIMTKISVKQEKMALVLA